MPASLPSLVSNEVSPASDGEPLRLSDPTGRTGELPAVRQSDCEQGAAAVQLTMLITGLGLLNGHIEFIT